MLRGRCFFWKSLYVLVAFVCSVSLILEFNPVLPFPIVETTTPIVSARSFARDHYKTPAAEVNARYGDFTTVEANWSSARAVVAAVVVLFLGGYRHSHDCGQHGCN